MMKKIAIIGCGFSGTMTAVHLIKSAHQPIELVLIDKKENLHKGIAYNPNSKIQLLNVITSRMSAFGDDPDHFLNWVSALDDYQAIDRNLLANSFLPRYLYGKYLEGIWSETVQSAQMQPVQIHVKHAHVLDMNVMGHEVMLSLDNGENEIVQYCVIASGNQPPGNPEIKNTQFFNSRNYFRNPWDACAVKDQHIQAPVLIMGNGLSMADTVLALVENGFRNKIYTISPHGYRILPHKHTGTSYPLITEELKDKRTLHDIVGIVNKHIRIAGRLGFTAEPVIDGIRPLTQQLWQNLAPKEKRLFMTRLRHQWDAARHRIPIHIHERLRQLSAAGNLDQYTGKVIDISENERYIKVIFFDKSHGVNKEMLVSAVINCTGPETDLMKADGSFLKECLVNGILIQDDLKLGLMADPATFEVFNSNHQRQENILALGSLLKGVLWESTAVKELREQAVNIAMQLVQKIQQGSGSQPLQDPGISLPLVP
jgi:uncharacterized NAD(P)/FAD-binding protein YdhS